MNVPPLPGHARAVTFVLMLTCCLSITQEARGNGRFPAASRLLVDPHDPAHLVVRATYGILQSFDGGGTWSWICESSVGYLSEDDPPLVIAPGGGLLAGTYRGLSSSSDRGCTFALGDELDGTYVADLDQTAQRPLEIALLTASATDGGFASRLYRSTDGGHTFQPSAGALPSSFQGLTCDLAPSLAERVYVSGIEVTAQTGVVAKSNDRGDHFDVYALASPFDRGAPYLAGVDPQHPDHVYVRLAGTAQDQLLESQDAARTFASTFVGKGRLLGWAISPAGDAVAVGGPDDGVWVRRAPASWEKRSDVAVHCLTWTERGLFACAEEGRDGFTVGVSTDEGRTFQALGHLQNFDVQMCPQGSTTRALCPDELAPTRGFLSSRAADGDASARDDAPLGDAQEPSSSGASAGCTLNSSAQEPGVVRLATWTALLVFSALQTMRRVRGAWPSSENTGGSTCRHVVAGTTLALRNDRPRRP